MAETEKKAAELITELETASKEEAQAVLTAEKDRGDHARSTVVKAAEDRLEALAIPGEPQEGTPSGVWAQLLDGSGKPVLVDGNPVRSELVT